MIEDTGYNIKDTGFTHDTAYRMILNSVGGPGLDSLRLLKVHNEN